MSDRSTVSNPSAVRRLPLQPDDQHDAGAARTTTTLLIRHAHTDAVHQRLAGRAPGWPLSARGAEQAERLGRRLARLVALDAVYTSPLERAVQTAAALLRHQAAALHVCDDLTEVDFGAWTGRTFAELDGDPAWREFNESRSTAAIPDGERPVDVQRRIVSAIARLAAAHEGGTIALVSHADVVRSALLCYAAIPLDLHYRFDIGPASVSAIAVASSEVRLLCVNDTSFAAE
jgi:probable phosphoglycerate mutase